MSVFALFMWLALAVVIALAAWGVGYDMGHTEAERMRRLGTLPPPSKDTRRDVFNEYENKTGERYGRVLEFTGGRRTR